MPEHGLTKHFWRLGPSRREQADVDALPETKSFSHWFRTTPATGDGTLHVPRSESRIAARVAPSRFVSYCSGDVSAQQKPITNSFSKEKFILIGIERWIEIESLLGETVSDETESS